MELHWCDGSPSHTLSLELFRRKREEKLWQNDTGGLREKKTYQNDTENRLLQNLPIITTYNRHII